MRKAHKEITDRRVVEGLLDACHVGRLGTVGPGGRPMIKPLNFCFHGGHIYFRSAREGEKMAHIATNPRVCFVADLPVALVRARKNPCDCEYLYRSVIAEGRAVVVADEAERREALDALMRKYQPGGGWGDYTEKRLGLTAVVRIEIERMTGKEDLGKGALREAALAVLKGGGPLPVVLERPEE
jgi:nitroimidazol reductase NimA-like FMN-containing flavoprotein (pyridoxamine 5'-phosphate oxidase superfamily)